MTKIKVIESRCPKNHHCPVVRICTYNAVTQKNILSAPEIIEENCANCGKCVRLCGYGAFQTTSL